MGKWTSSMVALAAFLMVAGACGSAMAQAPDGQNPPAGNTGQNGTGNNGRQRGNRNFDPAQMRERYMNSIKERLGSPDDEWKVLEPRIEKVMTAQRALRSEGRMGRTGRTGRTRGNANANDTATPTTPAPELSPVAKAAEELRKAADNKDTPAADLTQKLAAYHEAKEKAQAELTSAQKELREVVTPRQEAILVTSNLLE